MHAPRRLLCFSLLALAIPATLAGCDDEARDAELVPAQTWQEGVGTDSDAGAFRVILTTEDGLAVGANTLFIRLGFHDPSDPLAPGRGIPAAEVALDAWMPYGDSAIEGLRGEYVEDGRYAIELDLPEPGVWQLDFDLAVGDGVHDSVSFAFVVGE